MDGKGTGEMLVAACISSGEIRRTDSSRGMGC